MLKKLLISGALAVALSAPAFGATNINTLVNELPPQVRNRAEVMLNIGINSSAVAEMLQNMVQKKINTQTELQIINQVIAAKQQGLPVDPVVEKADEGFAKGVSATKIVQAMQQVRNTYAYAYAQTKKLNIPPQAQKQVATNIANALSAGMTMDEMNQIMTQLREKTKTMNQTQAQALAVNATATAATFVMYGAPGTQAASTVTNALKNNMTPHQLEQIRTMFMQAATSTDPTTVVNHINSSVTNGSMPSMDIMTGTTTNMGGSGGGMGGSGGGMGGSGGGMGGSGGGMGGNPF